MTALPWWKAELPPWSCVGCGVEFGADEIAHLVGQPLCGDAGCSRLCERCFVQAQMRRELTELLHSIEEGT